MTDLDLENYEKVQNIIDARPEYRDGQLWDWEVVQDAFKRVDDLSKSLAYVEELLWEFQNNPNIELGEKGQEKIEIYFSGNWKEQE